NRSEVHAPREIHVIPRENHSRNFRNDIIPAVPERGFQGEYYFEEGRDDLLVIHTSRSAILDYLPEDFFVAPDNTDEFWDESGREKSREEVEAYRKMVSEQLESARRFFRPLEVEYNKIRIQRELEEIVQLENQDQILVDFWGDFPLSNDRWRRFIRTLHLTPYVLGDRVRTRALLEFVMGTPVELNFEIEEYYEPSEKEQRELHGEEQVLGFNMLIGNAIYDYLEVCYLKICDLSTAEFYRFQDAQSDDNRLLEEIKAYYFPLNMDVRLDFSISANKDHTGEEAPLMVIGYSSTLGGQET
ncbi:MAG: hypothetical protein KDD15_17995, partial [Lewinella sp.]|nr:hypothetical protein [Lewinella sp.]